MLLDEYTCVMYRSEGKQNLTSIRMYATPFQGQTRIWRTDLLSWLILLSTTWSVGIQGVYTPNPKSSMQCPLASKWYHSSLVIAHHEESAPGEMQDCWSVLSISLEMQAATAVDGISAWQLILATTMHTTAVAAPRVISEKKSCFRAKHHPSPISILPTNRGDMHCTYSVITMYNAPYQEN